MINDGSSKYELARDNLKRNPSESEYISVTWNDWFVDIFQLEKSYDVSILFLKVDLKEELFNVCYDGSLICSKSQK